MRYVTVSILVNLVAEAHLLSGAAKVQPTEQPPREQQEPARQQGELHTYARRRSSSSAGQLPPHRDTLRLYDPREHCDCT
jgi:hypothetical protein